MSEKHTADNTIHFTNATTDAEMSTAIHECTVRAMEQLGEEACMRITHATLYTLHALCVHEAHPHQPLNEEGRAALATVRQILALADIETSSDATTITHDPALNTETKLTPHAATCATFAATLAMQDILARRRCLKITRSTDNALFVSVHDTGDPRALFRWRINCKHLHTDAAVADAVSELKIALRQAGLLVQP